MGAGLVYARLKDRARARLTLAMRHDSARCFYNTSLLVLPIFAR